MHRKTVLLAAALMGAITSLGAETRTMREAGSPPKVWVQTIQQTRDADGHRTVTLQEGTTVRVTRWDRLDRLVWSRITAPGMDFVATAENGKITARSGSKVTVVDLRGLEWFDGPESAARSMRTAGSGSKEFLIIPEEDPERAMVLTVRRGGPRERAGVAVLEFEIGGTGAFALVMPKLHVWLTPDGGLVAQETLPRPPTGNLKPILHEVITTQP